MIQIAKNANLEELKGQNTGPSTYRVLPQCNRGYSHLSAPVISPVDYDRLFSGSKQKKVLIYSSREDIFGNGMIPYLAFALSEEYQVCVSTKADIDVSKEADLVLDFLDPSYGHFRSQLKESSNLKQVILTPERQREVFGKKRTIGCVVDEIGNLI